MILEGDTVLCITKSQAVEIANIAQEFSQLEVRLDNSLAREEKLQQAWGNTSRQLEQQQNQITLLSQRLESKQNELDDAKKLFRKEKRKKFIQNVGIGFLTGTVATLLLTN